MRALPLLTVLACASPTPPRTPALATAACHPAPASPAPLAIAVLGSGGPHSFGSAASGYVIFVDGTPRILVDAGPGTFVRLGEMDIPLPPIDTVLLTHLHVDHSGDLAAFVKSRNVIEDTDLRFRIAGPSAGGDFPSTQDFVDRLFGAHGVFAYLPSFRNHLQFDVSDLPSDVGAPVHEVLRDGDLRVTSIAVQHDGAPAVAFRVEHAGHAIVVSGDLTSRTDNLARLAEGADLLIYDAMVLDPPGSPAPLYELHTPPARIGQIAAQARVRSLVLSHRVPAVDQAEADVRRSIAASYRGPVQLAHDCQRIDLGS